MGRPLVSIVIPCYNSEGFVADAIRSALAQSYARVEVVVVDDGSTDGSLGIIRSFGDSIRYLTGTNVGAAAARNKGAAAARGELLQFLDADDLLYRHKLERQVPLAERHRPGMVFCDADVEDSKTNRNRRRWGTGSVSTNDPVVHAVSVTIQTSGPLHWRETFEGVGGFRAHTPPCDDRDLHLRLACHGVAFHHCSETLYLMRRVSESLSKQDPFRGLRLQRSIGEDAYEALAREDQLTSERRAAFAGYFAGTARHALRHGDHTLAEECFRRARQIHPDGGIPQVYSRGAQVMRRMVGPATTERLVAWKRSLRGYQDVA